MPPPPRESPVTRSVVTTTDNPVELRPFSVLSVTCPARWDPTGGALPVAWEITDPNRRIQNGRILYRARWNHDYVAVHHRMLQASDWTPGAHSLPLGNRWDGTIGEGISERNGERATADLSIMEVIVEVWNTTESEPARGVRPGMGRTERAGEWKASGAAAVEIDAIVEARWDAEWVIPYDDPEEPAKGHAGMNIRIKNVRENTPVHLAVRRIQDVADSSSDQPYVDDVGFADSQPGLQGAVVRGDRVVLANGNAPYCEFSNYDEHWVHEGNNFYTFWVAFGNGDARAASERDYVNNERACLHMRFTVFLHAPKVPQANINAANQLHHFFRGQTRYYRSYVKIGGLSSIDDWIKYFRHRYVVAILGHGGCACRHADHPQEPVPSAPHAPGTPAPTFPMQMFHSGFDPDLYVCPTGIQDTAQARQELRHAREEYHCDFGGCGNASPIVQQLGLGSSGGKRMGISTLTSVETATCLPVFTVSRDGSGNAWKPLKLPDETPRMFLYCSGCRSMLTPYLGHKFTDPDRGTRYFSGWVYSVDANVMQTHVTDFFSRWIKGTSGSPAPTEYETSRIEQAFRDASAAGNREDYHPRIMNRGGVISNVPAPDEGETALA